MGAQEQAAVLLARDPANLVAVDNPDGVAKLLGSLREAGAQEQVTALADRAANQISLAAATRSASPTCWTASGGQARRSRSPPAGP